MNISEIEVADQQAVIDLWRMSGLLSNPANDPQKDINLALETDNSTVFVGKSDDGQVIASVMAGHDGHRGWIYYLAVDPNRRGECLGQTILRHAEKWLKSQNMPKVQLMVRPTNTGVISFYQNVGYQLEGTQLLSMRLDDKGFHGSRKKVTVPRTWLEMTKKPAARQRPFPPGFTLLRASDIDTDFFLYLLKLIGGPWHWTERLWLTRDALERKIKPAQVFHLVVYKDGQPAGFCEINQEEPGESEIVFFGLREDLAGMGAGGAFMEAVLDAAWSNGIQRVHLNTCGLDHPNALPFYQKNGFTPWKQDEFTHYI